MKRSALLLIACLFLSSVSFAQQNPADAPASKQDIEKYLDVMHTRDMMKTMMDSMSKQLHQIFAEQMKKDPSMEARVNKMMDDVIKSMPIDDLLDAMIPVYQKHFTKGNIDDLLAFYSTPTGQKIIKELPAITAEAMQAATPIYKTMMATAMQRVQDELAQIQKEKDPKKQTQQN